MAALRRHWFIRYQPLWHHTHSLSCLMMMSCRQLVGGKSGKEGRWEGMWWWCNNVIIITRKSIINACVDFLHCSAQHMLTWIMFNSQMIGTTCGPIREQVWEMIRGARDDWHHMWANETTASDYIWLKEHSTGSRLWVSQLARQSVSEPAGQAGSQFISKSVH